MRVYVIKSTKLQPYQHIVEVGNSTVSTLPSKHLLILVETISKQRNHKIDQTNKEKNFTAASLAIENVKYVQP